MGGSQAKQPIRHIVMLGLKDDVSAEQVKSVREDFLGLPSRIPVIKGLEFGEDLKFPSGQNHPAGKNRTLVAILNFDCTDDYEEYAAHKEHLQVIEKNKPLMAPGSRAAIQFGESTTDTPTQAVRHVVMFGFKDDGSAEQIEAAKKALQGMPGKISSIKRLEVGEDLKLPSGQKHPAGKNRSLAVIVDFESKEDYEAYATHTEHQKVIQEFLKPIMADGSRAAVQFARL
eukprot:gnl/MRDRNA2_/MRDRNA2_35137_c0_seq1.p1 gnl/MRDRNA2_/MRDRNA2_35137_c0~~gnl/MRDRNA2_/MRDRNA2_35137_c0_seq1.p1  ORF type:complete len:229 (+),score=57.02 gnl/MRDRNA2_/MRDRNA2_35137_c0_seq1:101-787(+)